MVVVRKRVEQGRTPILHFSKRRGMRIPNDYLESLLKEGEKLTPDSPILTPKVAPKPFIRSTNIGDMIRAAIRKAGFKWRPCVLRAYFDTQLMLAESKWLFSFHDISVANLTKVYKLKFIYGCWKLPD